MSLIVFSRNEYGTYRATPGNAIVSKGDSGARMLNLTQRDITVTATWLGAPIHVRAADRSPVPLPVGALDAGQYFYTAAVDGTPFVIQGNSGPGIIVTP